MPIKEDSSTQLDPRFIVIGTRQRGELGDIESLKLSIAQYGILNPIIVTAGQKLLIGGRRRLECALQLNLDSVPVRFYETLDEAELQIIELEENLKREDPPWRDKVLAIGNLFELKRKKNPSYSETELSSALSLSEGYTKHVLALFRSLLLEEESYRGAETLNRALETLHSLKEKKAEEITTRLLNLPKNENAFRPAIPTARPNPETETETETDPEAETNSTETHPPAVDEEVIFTLSVDLLQKEWNIVMAAMLAYPMRDALLLADKIHKQLNTGLKARSC